MADIIDFKKYHDKKKSYKRTVVFPNGTRITFYDEEDYLSHWGVPYFLEEEQDD